MVQTGNFKLICEYVKKTFFPRWDRNNQWQIQEKNKLELWGALVRCAQESKTIYVDQTASKENGQVLLVHGIAHAVTNSFHGSLCQGRMLEAAETAQHIAATSLVKEIKKEIQEYKDTPKLEAAKVYAMIEESVWDRPDAAIDEILGLIGRNPNCPPEKLVDKYKIAQFSIKLKLRNIQKSGSCPS